MNYQFQPTCQIPLGTLDDIYTEAFGVKNNGCFVEVGAHDGWHWSNTWGLAEVGWKGLCVEPVPDLCRQCFETHKTHPKVVVTMCAIGPVAGPVKIGMCEYGASFLSKKDEFETVQFRLDDFLPLHGIQQHFDLLVIDVEGAEIEVLAGYTNSLWQPKLVIIERPPVPNQFTEQGYEQVYNDWINTIYRRKD
jgi:FkbM family methyltransferase